MDILQELTLPETWQAFIQYKTEKQHLSPAGQRVLEDFLAKGACVRAGELRASDYVPPLPAKKEISKAGTDKKRTVYFYPEEFQTFLKVIAFLLYRYDGRFAPNCYAFRRQLGVSDAIRRLRSIRDLSRKYCFKVDIHNYFNSISVPRLMEKLDFLKEADAPLYALFEKMFTADAALKNGKLCTEARGAMAGIPVSPFFANIYLSDIDWEFERQQVLYFRYSDDILLFADSREELADLQRQLCQALDEHKLALNPQKLHVSAPGEAFEFLGFSYQDGRIDLSENTIRKMKAKIRRKAHALRRWQLAKGLSGDKAAKGLIHAMNCKFYGVHDEEEFSWSRWFFPNLTTTKGLEEIDAYMQQYIRYAATGRHNKANYRIRYATLKEWGYRNLVHEYYKERKTVE